MSFRDDTSEARLSGEYVFKRTTIGDEDSEAIRSQVGIYRYQSPGGSVVHLDPVELADLVLFIIRRCPDVRSAVAGDLRKTLDKHEPQEVTGNGHLGGA